MNNFSSLIENSKRAVRYWWLLLIIGIALFVVGILIFVYPKANGSNASGSRRTTATAGSAIKKPVR